MPSPMTDADTKAEMKKVILELQSLGTELNSALDLAAAKIDANQRVGSALKELYDRTNARSEELLAQLERLQTSLSISSSK